MTKKENKKENKSVVVLDDKEYEIESMTDNQKLMVSHIADLNRKVETATFNLQQLQFGRQAFIDALKNGLQEDTKYPYNKEEKNNGN